MPTFLEPIANLPGPQFLVLYGVVIVLTLVAVGVWRYLSDPTRSLQPPPVQTSPDPYELAWLRDGEHEVIRVALFSLIERKLLEKKESGRVGQAAVDGDAIAELSPVEQAVFEHFAVEYSAVEFFKGGLPAKVRAACAVYDQRLEDEQLLLPAEVKAWRIGGALLGGAVIASLGGFKLAVALSRGKSNVGILIGMAVVAAIVLLILSQSGRLSARGNAYLERLRLAFAALKPQLDESPGSVATAGWDPSVLLYAGLFGVGALGAPYLLQYREILPKLSDPSVSGSSGGGCGSSCSTGSSCGGGGGCGGGGCGGCGGGD